MKPAPAFNCFECGRHMGKSASHCVIDGNVWCSRCVDRKWRFNDVDKRGTRAGIAWTLGLWGRQDETDEDGRPILDAVVSADGINAKVWCRFCRRWHLHGHHDSNTPDCPLTSISRGARCTCPIGTGDGHRWAHCHNNSSPYNETGYVLREVRRETR